jgi:superfamily II DNA or RNA helicase
MKCIAITLTGKQCSKNIYQNSNFCNVHIGKNVATITHNTENKNTEVKTNNTINVKNKNDISVDFEIKNNNNLNFQIKDDIMTQSQQRNITNINFKVENKNIFSMGLTKVEKGTLYEIYINNYINNYINTLPETLISYMWRKVPEQVLYMAGLITDYNKHLLNRRTKKMIEKDYVNPLQDTGVDIVTVNKDYSITFVQCKNFMACVKKFNLETFFTMLNKYKQKGIVYHSQDKIAASLSEIIDSTDEKILKFIHKPILENDQNIELTNTINFKQPEIKLYQYQQEIVDKYVNYYKNKNKAILNAPCGVGKTIISCFIAKEYDIIIFITPLKQYAEQNIDRFKQYDNRNCLLVTSDGVRDVKTVREFIDTNKEKKIMISATYRSCDVISGLLDMNINFFIIIDEFHNLSAEHVYGNYEEKEQKDNIIQIENSNINKLDENVEEDESKSKGYYINKIINSNHKILYMSATPRIYDIENKKDSDVEDLLGEIVHSMDFKVAIKNKYISDYELCFPIMEDESLNQLNSTLLLINDFLEYKLEDIDLARKCCFFFQCLKIHGHTKCIIYFQSIQELKKFMNYFNEINTYYAYDCSIDSIIADDNKPQRIDKIKKFETFEGHSVLLSVKILDEAVDLPICNSIYITYNSESKIRNVQRLCRAVRIDSNDIAKKAKIMVWATKMTELSSFISSIKEIDDGLIGKIKYVSFDTGLSFINKETQITYINKYLQYFTEIGKYRSALWDDHLKQLEEFIIKNNRRPHYNTEPEPYTALGRWGFKQLENYKIKYQIMSDLETRKKWEKFMSKYGYLFRTIKETWYDNFELLKNFIDINNKKPTLAKGDPDEISLMYWLSDQISNYKDKRAQLANEQNYTDFTEFLEKYNRYFLTDEELWHIHFKKAKNFIDIYKKNPKSTKKGSYEAKLNAWIGTQLDNIKKKVGTVTKNKEINDEWNKFILEYGKYFRFRNPK